MDEQVAGGAAPRPDGAAAGEAEGLARRMKVSRSRLFAVAMAEFLERRRNREILDAINAAHARGPEPHETKLRTAMRAQHRRLLQGEW